MNNSKFQWILYVIVFVIVSTIAIQVYWNFKNYEINKQQLINDVQVSLDKAVDDYYTNLAEKTTVGFMFESNTKNTILENGKFKEIMNQIDEVEKDLINIDSIDVSQLDGISVFRGKKTDSIISSVSIKTGKFPSDTIFRDIGHFHDSIPNLKDIERLTSKIVVSIHNDTLVLEEVDSILKNELARKKIDFKYNLSFKTETDSLKVYGSDLNTKREVLSSSSKSLFLPPNSTLSINFTNETKLVLKRILTGILISTLLVLAVISCLFYLLKIIKRQKQLAELKNDLISNITHEFKTPIATIGVALESIKDFDMINDKEKTKKYLNISSSQLSKLNLMVEKLLETATLDSENLELNKDTINCVELIETLIKKHQLTTNKSISFDAKTEELYIHVDIFHFENAVSNIIDNAIKYGGDSVKIHLSKTDDIELIIEDNGNSLTKAQKDKIFEKFYRVPKGNTHDVKGFGIGLYYSKTIIEKHQGTLVLELSKDSTSFKISLPNGK